MREGYKDTVIGVIPEDWNVVQQGKVATFYNGRAYSIDEWETSGTPVIRLQNLTGRGNDYYYSNLNLPDNQYCNNGDLLYMWSASFGAFIWQGGRAIFHYHIWKIESDETYLLKQFHFYLLSEITRRMKTQSHGSTMMHVTKGEMEKLPIQLPAVNEQNKIATILSTVDDKIDAITDKITATQQIKNGLMQRLLTKGIGHTKFKNSPIGEIPESWDVKRIADFAEVTAGATPSTKMPNYWDGNIPWMNSGEINLKRIKSVEGRITELGFKNSSTKMIPCRSILMALAGQGKTRGKVAINEIELCTNQSLAAIMNFKEVDTEFLYHNLDSRYSEIRRMSTGDGGRGGLNLQIINSILVPLPSYSEQKRIGNILASFDEKLDILQDKKTQYDQLKQGLMQQLLTGNMRVNKVSLE